MALDNFWLRPASTRDSDSYYCFPYDELFNRQSLKPMTSQEEARRKAEERYPHHKERIIGLMINPSIDLQRDAFIAGYTADRWVDCKVRLPGTGEALLLYSSAQLTPVVGYWNGKRFHLNRSCFIAIHDAPTGSRNANGNAISAYVEDYTDGVTHWQPLEAPKISNDGQTN